MRKLQKRIVAMVMITVLLIASSITVSAKEGTQTGGIYGYNYITRMNVGYTKITASMFGEPESSTEPAPSVEMSVGAYDSVGNCIRAKTVSGTSRCEATLYPSIPSERFSYGQAFSYLEGYSMGGLKVYAS